MSEVPPQIPAFSPEDLVAAIQMIDEGVNQGAYKGWENIQRAIAVRARLLLFAQHWQGTIEAQQRAAGEAAGETADAPAGDEAPAKKTPRKKKAAE
jgi:hypothetical protein